MRKLLSCLLFVALAAAMHAQAAADSLPRRTLFQHLRRPDVLDITLSLDIRGLIRRKMAGNYQAATLAYKAPDGSPQELSVEVKPKGKARRQICEVPPLKIRFPEKWLAAQGLVGSRSLEMALVCQEESDFDQYILREYAVYRLYNMLTDRSLQVQLVRLTIQSPKGRKRLDERFAFLIEPIEDLAQRLQAEVKETAYLGPARLQADAFDRLSIFQFMVGNTDWSVRRPHNVEALQLPSDTLRLPVPYDFDYAGFVKTPYAIPAPQLNIPSVDTRYFQGSCRSMDHWGEVFEQFKQKKAEMLRFCQEFQYFDKASQRHTTGFLQDFFDLLENPTAVRKQIYEHCGGAYIR